MIRRGLILAYGVMAYLSGMATMAYSFGFFGNFFVLRSVDSFALLPLGEAIVTNVTLIVLFSLQHSGMARPAFRDWVKRVTPMCTERSTYVLFSCIVTVALMAFWQPMGGIVWSVDNSMGRTALIVAYVAGWALLLWATFLIGHFEMFGLGQAWRTFRNGVCDEPRFRTPGAYGMIRHPAHTGWLLIIWASPTMTETHLLLAAGLSVYVVIGIILEERSLSKIFVSYRQYKRKVPMLLPSYRRRLVQAATDE